MKNQLMAQYIGALAKLSIELTEGEFDLFVDVSGHVKSVTVTLLHNTDWAARADTRNRVIDEYIYLDKENSLEEVKRIHSAVLSKIAELGGESWHKH